jgi:hypothetical protein
MAASLGVFAQMAHKNTRNKCARSGNKATEQDDG